MKEKKQKEGKEPRVKSEDRSAKRASSHQCTDQKTRVAEVKEELILHATVPEDQAPQGQAKNEAAGRKPPEGVEAGQGRDQGNRTSCEGGQVAKEAKAGQDQGDGPKKVEAPEKASGGKGLKEVETPKEKLPAQKAPGKGGKVEAPREEPPGKAAGKGEKGLEAPAGQGGRPKKVEALQKTPGKGGKREGQFSGQPQADQGKGKQRQEEQGWWQGSQRSQGSRPWSGGGYGQGGHGQGGYGQGGYGQGGHGQGGYGQGGMDKEGMHKEGMDKECMDKEGMGKEGMDKQDMDKEGVNKEESGITKDRQ